MQTEPQPNSSDTKEGRANGARPWIMGALFVWTLTGAVAFAAFSSRGPSTPSPTLEPVTDSNLPQPSLPLAQNTGEKTTGNPNGIQWASNFEDAMKRARLEDKPIMIDFYTDWCGVCKMLDRDVLPVKEVVEESRNWVSIKINAEKRPDVAGAYGVTGYPTLVFAEKSGRPLSILPGFAPAPEFVKIMREARGKLKPNA